MASPPGQNTVDCLAKQPRPCTFAPTLSLTFFPLTQPSSPTLAFVKHTHKLSPEAFIDSQPSHVQLTLLNVLAPIICLRSGFFPLKLFGDSLSMFPRLTLNSYVPETLGLKSDENLSITVSPDGLYSHANLRNTDVHHWCMRFFERSYFPFIFFAMRTAMIGT